MQVANHMWLDYLLGFLIQLDDFPNAQLSQNIPEKYFIEFSKSKHLQETKKKASTFLDCLNQFYV